MDLGLSGRVAIITGATRGIGHQVALDLASEGCALVLCARTAGDLDAVARAMEAAGADVLVVAADLREPEAAAEVARRAEERFGRIDILVNNAGVGSPRKLLALTDTEWRETFELNFFAAVRFSAVCVDPMLARGWGRIVNIASIQALEPDPMFGPYGASKAALVNLTKCYSRAFTEKGVLTNCVVPGVTATEMVRANTASAAAALGISESEVIERTLARAPIPAGRLGEVGEIAAAVVFLTSARASWISGACLAVDGGTLRGF